MQLGYTIYPHESMKTLFNGRDDLRMRIWLSDGVNGFEQLTPDRRIPNADLLGLRTLKEPLTVYVDATNGDDLESGLSPSRAKRTIQAGVDMIPHRLEANATIEVANGIYREQVNILDHTSNYNSWLSLVGDEYTGNPETTIPAVRVTGTDNDITPIATREFAIYASDVQNLRIVGFELDYGSLRSLWVQEGRYILSKIRASHGNIHITNHSRATLTDVWGIGSGIEVQINSYVGFVSGGAINAARGLFVNANSSMDFGGTSKFNNNTVAIEIDANSTVNFSSAVPHVGFIQNNTIGIRTWRGAVCSQTYTGNTISGNGTNTLVSPSSTVQ